MRDHPAHPDTMPRRITLALVACLFLYVSGGPLLLHHALAHQTQPHEHASTDHDHRDAPRPSTSHCHFCHLLLHIAAVTPEPPRVALIEPCAREWRLPPGLHLAATTLSPYRGRAPPVYAG